MKLHAILILLGLCLSLPVAAQETKEQEELPYYQIPEYPESYTAATVAARMVDGLGFRYYWATEGLRPEDLTFRPNDEARTSEETIDHILSLSRLIINAVLKQPNIRTNESSKLSFAEKRALTLNNLKQASDILKNSSAEDLQSYKIIFVNGEQTTEYPFWNQLNGPIADALWHIGQVVSFRRSSGNPFNARVSVLVGKLND